MNSDTPTVWIDILSDPAVRLAARAWNKGLSETWGILSRAIQAEDISQFMPLTQFDEYIALFTSKPLPIPTISPLTKPRHPHSLDKRLKNLWQNIAWQPIAIALCILTFIIGQFATSNQSVSPTPTFNSTSWVASVNAIACEEDTIAGVPYEYSRCNPNPSTPEPDEPYYFDEEQTDSPASCLIKGNISFDTGEKIYHLPGQKFYDSTTIDPAYGERWFCTEAQAQAAGWRKSRQ